MTTNGTGITREEAETIFNMVKLSKEHNDGTIAVLKKLQTAYPDLLHGTDFPRLIREYDARIRVNKQEAKKKIDALLEEAKKAVQEATKIASASKVSFELYVGDPDISQYYDADYGGWNSSNC
jgi:hypothetical protein